MEHADRLIEELCTVAGIVLEVALLRERSQSLAARVTAIEAAASDALTLARAAVVIASRYVRAD